jgi:murein DD-endopeptidase MepM/ murein hydrolase activator NlpD
MTTSDRIRDIVQAGSLLSVSGALLIGAVGPVNAETFVEPAPAPIEALEEPEVANPIHPLDPDEMAAAAEQAKKIEVQREKRAAARAQRSSGPMFTPTRNYNLSARYGQAGGWSRGYHTGLDFAAAPGTPVFAALAGKVIEVGYAGAYGINIVILHDNGRKTRYAHLSATDVSQGQKVLRGQRIGAVGSTGNSTGPHLHFEVFTGKGEESFRNPAEFL